MSNAAIKIRADRDWEPITEFEDKTRPEYLVTTQMPKLEVHELLKKEYKLDDFAWLSTLDPAETSHAKFVVHCPDGNYAFGLLSGETICIKLSKVWEATSAKEAYWKKRTFEAEEAVKDLNKAHANACEAVGNAIAELIKIAKEAKV